MGYILGMKFAKGAVMETVRWIIYIVLLILLVFLVWSAVNKKQEVNDYTKGATHNESSFTINEGPLSFPCGKFITYDPDSKKKVKKQ